MEENNWDGLDTVWWRVRTGVCVKLPPQTKVDVSQVVQTGVCGPHASEDLCHVTQIDLNVMFLDGRDACRQDDHVDLLREYLQVGNGVCKVGEVRRKGEPHA